VELGGGHRKESAPEGEGSRAREAVRLTLWVAIVAAALYAGFVLWSRHQEDRAFQQRILEKQRAEDARTVEMLGGSQFKILSFYVSPPTIRRGGSAQLCYGVSEAKTVRIQPPVGETWPSASRCLDISPKKDTTYTLTSEDAAGHTQTATVNVKVR
jgi:hypothetical protein